MHMKPVWLAVLFMALHLGAGTAEACSCPRPTSNLDEELRKAHARAVAVYRARILTVRLDGFLGLLTSTRAQVLEVFKGELKPGSVLTLPSGDFCSLPFEVEEEYLMYANGDSPSEVEGCSRTQHVSIAAAELTWLRTGKIPPQPVALQRESVSCRPCDLFSIGDALLSIPGAVPGQWRQLPSAETAMKEGGPFLERADPATSSTLSVLLGRTADGRFFELAATPKSSTEACLRKIHLRWCKSVDVSESVQCLEPGAATLQCDETTTRKASWMPLEAIPPEACSWFSADSPNCQLKTAGQPLPEGATRAPVLRCRPTGGHDGGADGEYHRCRVEAQPEPTDPKR